MAHGRMLDQVAITVAFCVTLSGGALAQNVPTFYDRATSTIRKIFDDPVRCAPEEHVKQKWLEWSKCVAEGTERMAILFDYSPGVVKIVKDYEDKVRVIGHMIDDRILSRDNGLKQIGAERDRFMEAMTPLIQDRVYRESAGLR